MARGRGFSPRGGYHRGGGRGSSSWSSRGGGGGGGYSDTRFAMDHRGSYDPRTKYGGDRFGSRPHADEYHKSYRMDMYSGRGDSSRRSPDRKRMKMEGPSSRHESSYSGYGSSRHESTSSYSDRRGYSGERHPSSTPYRKEEFHRPSGPSPRGSYRGRISSRGSRGLRARDRPGRRRLIDSSYGIRRRAIARQSDFNRRLKIARMRSIARKVARRNDSEDDKEETPVVKQEHKEDDGTKNDTTGKESTETKEGDESKSSIPIKKEMNATLPEPSPKKDFIKLQCPHCNVNCVTFRKYENHLISKMHLSSMRRLAIKQKSILLQMRKAQRKSQNEMEKNSSDDIEGHTNFCALCKLNYNQKKSVHQISEGHKNMKKFLLPFCKICHVTFRSPMGYETHIASIKHLKRKQISSKIMKDEFPDDNDLENFTTIDSVGDGDAEPEGAIEEDKSGKEIINIGIEKIKKVESYYCELCGIYMPKASPEELPKVLTKHCKQKTHMQRYIRLKEREHLVKKAELLQRKETAERTKREGDNNPDAANTVAKTDETSKETEDGADDKIWADVDKDLGDILAEAESGNKSSDEDEDSHVNGERYDRFKLSEKNDDDNLMKEDEESILDNNPEIKEAAVEV